MPVSADAAYRRLAVSDSKCAAFISGMNSYVSVHICVYTGPLLWVDAQSWGCRLGPLQGLSDSVGLRAAPCPPEEPRAAFTSPFSVPGPWGPPRHRGAAASCEAGPGRSERPGRLLGPSVSLAHVSSRTEGTSAPADPSMSFQVLVLLPTRFKCLPSPDGAFLSRRVACSSPSSLPLSPFSEPLPRE